jgi:hypothetical protein
VELDAVVLAAQAIWMITCTKITNFGIFCTEIVG